MNENRRETPNSCFPLLSNAIIAVVEYNLKSDLNRTWKGITLALISPGSRLSHLYKFRPKKQFFSLRHYKMGQEPSKPMDSPVSSPKREESESNTPPSMESLLAEAAAFGNEDENLSMEAKAQKALECPCIQNLRSGPCGSQFSEAFLCFLKSTAEEKGSDCVIPFVALQKCIKTNPNAFPKDVLENDEVEREEKKKEDYKIIPPRWSVESSSPKKNESSQSKSKYISYLISILIVLGWLLGIYKSLTARGKHGPNWYNYYNPACFIALNSRFLSFSIINWRR
ncbi:hypothetical protein L1887_40054 [Cichorium endivia]|nr:hypothetical protein L1887_40054 [Cichorium endivia]